MAQLSRRPGAGMVFLTLRDTAADLSVTVTCSTAGARRRRAGRSPRATASSSGPSPRSTPRAERSRCRPREIRHVGLGELLATARAAEVDPRRRGTVRRRPQEAAALPAPRRRPDLRTRSAAERDVVENARRRWPAVTFHTREVAVQGATAAAQVTAALQQLDADTAVDVIVITRGGGSVEDLLPFSEESLIRAVANAATPVVSAIGHEQDAPLLDLVADVRASTPTDAARRVVPDVAFELDAVAAARRRIAEAVSVQAGRRAGRARPAAQPAGAGDAGHVGRGTRAGGRRARPAQPPRAGGRLDARLTPSSRTPGPGSGRCRRRPPSTAATPWSRPRTAPSSAPPPARARHCSSASRTAASPPPPMERP